MSSEENELLTESDLKAFLDEYGDRIYSYLCVFCKGEESAADTLQNAYMKFIAQVRKGRVRRQTAVHYLLTIARKDYFAQLRKEDREMAVREEAMAIRPENKETQGDVARELRMIVLETALDPDLPEDLAQVMRFRFLEHMDIAEICSKTGRSRSTVYRLTEKALTTLADACRGAGLTLEEAGL